MIINRNTKLNLVCHLHYTSNLLLSSKMCEMDILIFTCSKSWQSEPKKTSLIGILLVWYTVQQLMMRVINEGQRVRVWFVSLWCSPAGYDIIEEHLEPQWRTTSDRFNIDLTVNVHQTSVLQRFKLFWWDVWAAGRKSFGWPLRASHD